MTHENAQPRARNTSRAQAPRRVAVIDPYSTAAQVAGVLAEYGAETVAVLTNQFPTSPAYPATHSSSEYAHVHTYRGDLETTARTLAALEVTDVMAGSEPGVHLADLLARKLHLRGNDPATSALRREKYAMAEGLRAAGLAHPHTYAATSVREARRAALLIGTWPVVVKPLASAGSDQVNFARTMAEVERAASSILSSRDVFGHANNAVLCQRYITGTQFAVNTVSRNGEHQLAEVWLDTRTSIAAHRMIYDRMELLPPEDQRIPGMFAYVARCLDALGIDEGPAHSEVMLTDAGPVLIETGARVQGGDSVVLQRAASGSSHTDAAIKALLSEPAPTRKPAARYPYRKPVVQLFLQAPRNAAVGPAQAIAALLEVPGVLGLVHPLRPGTPVSETIDLLTSPGTVYVTGRESKCVQTACEKVRALEAAGLYIPAAAEPRRELQSATTVRAA